MPVSNERYRRLLEAAEKLASCIGMVMTLDDFNECGKAEEVIKDAHEHLLTAKRTEVMNKEGGE